MQSYVMKRLASLEATVTMQGAEILSLKHEVAMLKGSSSAEVPEAQAPMTDAEDARALRPPLTRQEIDDLLEDTASEPDADRGPLEDHWAYRAADL